MDKRLYLVRSLSLSVNDVTIQNLLDDMKKHSKDSKSFFFQFTFSIILISLFILRGHFSNSTNVFKNRCTKNGLPSMRTARL